jgi:hypothetical protein
MKDSERPSLADGFADGMKMIRQFWSAAGVPMPTDFSAAMSGLPSMLVPTLDVGELDKRIADLRAVEQWLAVNSNMLRASIQTLEVQRNTIATLQTLGHAMATPARTSEGANKEARPAAAARAQPAAAAKPPRRTRRAPGADAQAPAASPLDPGAWWNALQDQFARIASAAAGAQPPAASGAESAAHRKRARKDEPAA